MPVSHKNSLLTISLLLPAIGFAETRLPAALIQVPESVQTIFVAETEAAAFHRFDVANDTVELHGSYYMSIGKAGAGKQRTGDKRTPLGVYFVTEQLDTSRLHEKYGVTAFPLDYPNVWDQRAERSGDGIWVHGVDAGGGERPALDTEGCVALRNEDLTLLASSFDENVTPVVVVTEVEWVTPAQNDALRLELRDAVDKWLAAQSTLDLHAYLSMYDDGFQRWGLDKSQWSVLSADSLADASDDYTMSDLLLLKYPQEADVYLSRFNLQRSSATQALPTTKRLYWQRNAQGDLRVIAEDDG